MKTGKKVEATYKPSDEAMEALKKIEKKSKKQARRIHKATLAA